MLRSDSEGDELTFKYYDASEDAVLDIQETYTFKINDLEGTLVDPHFLNIGAAGGENEPDWVDTPGAYEFTAVMNAQVLLDGFAIAEEITFRGVLQGWLARILGGRSGAVMVAVVITSLVWALGHAKQNES